MGDGSSTMGWLERTFLYTFGLSGLILLLHSGNIWIQVVHPEMSKICCKGQTCLDSRVLSWCWSLLPGPGLDGRWDQPSNRLVPCWLDHWIWRWFLWMIGSIAHFIWHIPYTLKDVFRHPSFLLWWYICVPTSPFFRHTPFSWSREWRRCALCASEESQTLIRNSL